MWKRLARTFSTPPETAKKTISRGQQNNRIPYWFAKCEILYRTLLQCLETKHDSISTATALLTRFNKKWRDRRFRLEHQLSHSRRKAWRMLK